MTDSSEPQVAKAEAAGKPSVSSGGKRIWPWGVVGIVVVCALLVGVTLGSVFIYKTVNQTANAYTTNFEGVTAFQGQKAYVYFGISAGLAGGLCNTTTVQLGAAASITPVYLNATGGTVCGPGGFAEVFAIPTNTSANGIGTHFLNFTFVITYGSAAVSHMTTIEVNTIATTGFSTWLYFYIVFSAFPVGGISGFNIYVSQST